MFVFGVLSGCSSMKKGRGLNNSKLVKTFYVGDEGIQYFFKPLEFKDDNGRLEMDFTFRHRKELVDSATVNLTIYDETVYKELSSIILNNNEHSHEISGIDLMYNEASSSEFISRFSIKIPLDFLKLLFDDNQWQVKVNAKDISEVRVYLPSNKTAKSIDIINRSVFVIL